MATSTLAAATVACPIFDAGLRRSVWHARIPKTLLAAVAQEDEAALWRHWRALLIGRHAAAEALAGSGKSPALLWAAPDDLTPEARRRIARLADRPAARPHAVAAEVDAWIESLAQRELDAASGLEALAWCAALPALSANLPGRVWWSLLEQLVESATAARSLDIFAQPHAALLWAGELRIALGCLFPELEPCRALVESGRATLSSGLVELTDGVGLPGAAAVRWTRPLLACWTRALRLGQAVRQRTLEAEAVAQYRWLVRQALRLTGPQGRQLLQPAASGPGDTELFRAALELGGDEKDWAIARQLPLAVGAPPRKTKTSGRGKKRPRARIKLPDPAYESEWAALGVLRTDWTARGEMLMVDYSQPTVQCELVGAGQSLLLGGWSLDVSLDGQPLVPEGAWEQICFHSDTDGDYLELEVEFAGGVRVQRQMFVARQDRFVLLADAVLAPRAGQLAYRAALPASPGIAVGPQRESHELFLSHRGKRCATVLPLALPEWRQQPAHGDVVSSEGRLVVEHARRGTALFAPLWIDVDARRRRQPFTWRPLTVAEDRRILPADEAAGYRVQFGRQHWLIYRSLAACGNRTVLGHNLVSEFLVARFSTTGEVTPLVEVE